MKTPVIMLFGLTLICTTVVCCFTIVYDNRVCAVLKVEGLNSVSK